VKDHLLRRTTLPEGVVFDSMKIGAVEHHTGVVEIEVSPLGLAETVTFYLRRGEDDFFTVVWDPITGGSRIRRGKETPPEAEAA
jgi:hypothetical protein